MQKCRKKSGQRGKREVREGKRQRHQKVKIEKQPKLTTIMVKHTTHSMYELEMEANTRSQNEHKLTKPGMPRVKINHMVQKTSRNGLLLYGELNGIIDLI